ncbi:hypothetical protein HERIO_49 [Hepatospora eriocheir]|uniref:Uncharacterized protein n=1 Tax=Hepatospora eriocheir TaxID=1081669 RepID=A0A1X0QEE0_9MICR|nr:hypothetical protein HERIO_49 [Hepatospora eriocheir]
MKKISKCSNCITKYHNRTNTCISDMRPFKDTIETDLIKSSDSFFINEILFYKQEHDCFTVEEDESTIPEMLSGLQDDYNSFVSQTKK